MSTVAPPARSQSALSQSALPQPSLPQVALAPALDGRGRAGAAGPAVAADGPDDRAGALYRYAVRHGGIGALEPAAAELGVSLPELFLTAGRLVELGLLRTDDTAGGRLVPASPQDAEARLVAPVEREIFRQRDLVDRLRARITAVTDPSPGAGGEGPAGAIDGLHGTAEIRGLFTLAAEVCRKELLVLQPGHEREDLLEQLLAPCYGVLDRDVAVRVVCPHRSRTGFADRARAKRLVENGARVRTLSRVPQATVVFDDTLAVVVDLPPGPDGQPTARRVQDRGMVRFLTDLFDQLWETGTPFTSSEPGYAAAADDLQQAIARLMAQGLTDEVVARRLGMSVRTCRRHIASLLRDLDAVSRFQAGVQAAGRFTISPSAPAPAVATARSA
ncbi:helix-turn-helix transcriptional regulator [Streptomyces sp. YIM 98790]|uniref:helix-turn-helix transcriptional regulator n=1 Tax=Streptomyces sp. YIM 98790 TaxID=2689077 RepID=UPI001407CE59|nr:helix-turn-helix transcriptional regulator [Streptomyces sp. YIM 98790]